MNLKILKKAARDFYYLLENSYPRYNSLGLVGDRYKLTYQQRQMLHRAIFSRKESLSRKRKLIPRYKLKDKVLGVDGHNVLITLENALRRRILILASDGLIRDIAGVSRKYHLSELTLRSLNLVFSFLKSIPLQRIDFYFDYPLSRSKDLAKLVKQLLEKNHLQGDSSAVKVPERYLINYKFVATSDSALIDSVRYVFDLAGWIIRRKIKAKIFYFNLKMI